MNVPHCLTLDYALGPGWLAPYVAALLEGRALARRCACGHVSFPPLRVCLSCGGATADWHDLPGTAHLLFRTTGADGDHALARLDGADTATVMRLEAVPGDAQDARLMPPGGALPRLILGPLAPKDRP